MVTGDHDYEHTVAERDAYNAGARNNHTYNPTNHTYPPAKFPAQFTVYDHTNINYATNTDGGFETQMQPPPIITTINWHPELKAFEVIIGRKTQMIHQEKIIDLVVNVAKENDLLKDAENRVTELVKGLEEIKENISSLIESCEDESCEEDHLCDKCIMIKGWAP